MSDEEIGKWSLRKLSVKVVLLIVGRRDDETKMRSMTDLVWLCREKKVEEPSLMQVKEASREILRREEPILSEEPLPQSVWWALKSPRTIAALKGLQKSNTEAHSRSEKEYWGYL